jgi:hypothetical protein
LFMSVLCVCAVRALVRCGCLRRCRRPPPPSPPLFRLHRHLSLSPSSGVKLSSTFLRMLFRSFFLLLTLIHPFRLSLSLSLCQRNFSSDDDVVVSLIPMLSQNFLMMMMMFVTLMARRFHEDRYWTHTSPGMYTSYVL